jgi:predicted phosphodiesterase
MLSRRFVVASDSHGDQVDPETERALFSFIADFKPQIRIHAGDLFDFRNLRRGASDDEKAHSLEDDWDMGTDFARRFFEGGKENHFLRGNHDERLWHFAGNAGGLLRDYAHDGIKRVEAMAKACRAKMLPYDSRAGVLRLGSLKVIHGYAAGIGAARKHAIVYRNCLFGHTHNCDVAGAESDEGVSEARGIGACCKLDMGYNAHQTGKLRHQNAFCYGLLFSDGTYQLNQAKKIDGRFYVASDFRAL